MYRINLLERERARERERESERALFMKTFITLVKKKKKIIQAIVVRTKTVNSTTLGNSR